MENKTILVTGGAGFIGSHFCKIAKKMVIILLYMIIYQQEKESL